MGLIGGTREDGLKERESRKHIDFVVSLNQTGIQFHEISAF